MSGLPPYDVNARCPKCRAVPGVTYHAGLETTIPGTSDYWPCFYSSRPGPVGEHLCRRCSRCGYSWMEATADATGNTPDLRSLPGGAG